MLESSAMSCRTVARICSTVNGGQVGEGNTIAFQVEHCDLHQTSCEFHADDMVFRAIEIQADGTTILIAFHVSGFFDNVSEQ